MKATYITTLRIAGIIVSWIIGVMPMVSLVVMICYMPLEQLPSRSLAFMAFSVLALCTTTWLFGFIFIAVSWINEIAYHKQEKEEQR